MCDTGECRPCRQELRNLDKAMGSARTYGQGQVNSLESNIEGRKVIGHGLVSVERSTINRGPAPVTLERGERPYRTRAQRTKHLREARKEDRTLIDGRYVSNECPCHGEYNGYLNWYCRCIPCSEAASLHRASSVTT